MKKLLTLFAVGFLCASALGQTTATITAHLADPGSTAVSSRAFVRAELKNTGGQQCRVASIALVTPYVRDFTPNLTGDVSFSIYKSSSITCGSSTGNTQWAFTVWKDGKPQPSCFLQVTGNVDLTNTACLNSAATPVTVAPTDSVYARVDGTNSGFTGNLTSNGSNFTGLGTLGAVTLGVTGKSTLPNIDNFIYVDGTKYPMTQAGIQSAFTDACAIAGAQNGTAVYIPPGTVSLTNTTGQQFTTTCPLKVIGPGPSQLWFVVANTVPNTVPTFRVKPSAATEGWFSFEGFRLVGNGKFGGDGFFLDSTTAGVNHFILNNVEIDSLDPAAWCVNMTAGAANMFFLGKITNSHLGCGINMNSSSTEDSWLIEHNNFSSAATDTLPCVNGTTQSGSSHITLFNNNGGCNGGFFISHGTTECKIIYNQIEQPLFTSTEANSAVIDLIGDTYSIDACEISGNNIGSNNFVTNLIRVGTATNTIISGNVLGIKATTGVGIVLAAASSGTKIDGTNEFIGVGGGAVAMTNASTSPFTLNLPTKTNTLPATIDNDTAGGISFTTNAGNLWQILNTGALRGPAGLQVILQGASSGSTSLLASATASGTLTLPATTGTLAVVPTITLKKGSGGGNYTSASTTYVVVDSTNLCYTVTIPTGWKLLVNAAAEGNTATAAVTFFMALTDNAACSTANAGLIAETTAASTSTSTDVSMALTTAITGDGAAHNIALQFKTSFGADSATLVNTSITRAPMMTFLLTPSN